MSATSAGVPIKAPQAPAVIPVINLVIAFFTFCIVLYSVSDDTPRGSEQY